ncbi:uncharacterized protein PV09_04351 [Verruconis gallopava]|uniref:BZIP domain-containing protein n=1 Tax=Verruconis gallopava TaxID=253628 RepID=A0A0D2ACI9_9PEZI|nr:uncharacterized protein PV09_04351 [Verruconis gallopava]KIW04603.1 hypothetical protein PV09_04351 [Verruconis gallopava]
MDTRLWHLPSAFFVRFDPVAMTLTVAPDQQVPHPPLTDSSLSFLPLFPSSQDIEQQDALSHTELYNYPPPSHIPYAESTASAASYNLSPAEDESSPKPALDEEKRRRNLAASARFRQKKKLHEQRLEQHTKELRDKANKLEERVAHLEKENAFLKALLTDKEIDNSLQGRKTFYEYATLIAEGEL